MADHNSPDGDYDSIMAQIMSKSSALATSALHSRVQESKPKEGEATPTNSEPNGELHPDSPSDNFMSKERVREGNELMVLEEEKASSPINRMYINDFYGNTESPSTSIYNQSGRMPMPFLKLHQVEDGESPQKSLPSEAEGKATIHTERNEANDPGMLKTQQMNLSKYLKSSQDLKKPTEVNNYMTPGESSDGSSLVSKLNLKNLSSNFKLFGSKFSKTSKHQILSALSEGFTDSQQEVQEDEEAFVQAVGILENAEDEQTQLRSKGFHLLKNLIFSRLQEVDQGMSPHESPKLRQTAPKPPLPHGSPDLLKSEQTSHGMDSPSLKTGPELNEIKEEEAMALPAELEANDNPDTLPITAPFHDESPAYEGHCPPVVTTDLPIEPLSEVELETPLPQFQQQIRTLETENLLVQLKAQLLECRDIIFNDMKIKSKLAVRLQDQEDELEDLSYQLKEKTEDLVELHNQFHNQKIDHQFEIQRIQSEAVQMEKPPMRSIGVQVEIKDSDIKRQQAVAEAEESLYRSRCLTQRFSQNHFNFPGSGTKGGPKPRHSIGRINSSGSFLKGAKLTSSQVNQSFQFKSKLKKIQTLRQQRLSKCGPSEQSKAEKLNKYIHQNTFESHPDSSSVNGPNDSPDNSHLHRMNTGQSELFPGGPISNRHSLRYESEYERQKNLYSEEAGVGNLVEGSASPFRAAPTLRQLEQEHFQDQPSEGNLAQELYSQGLIRQSSALQYQDHDQRPPSLSSEQNPFEQGTNFEQIIEENPDEIDYEGFKNKEVRFSKVSESRSKTASPKESTKKIPPLRLSEAPGLLRCNSQSIQATIPEEDVPSIPSSSNHSQEEGKAKEEKKRVPAGKTPHSMHEIALANELHSQRSGRASMPVYLEGQNLHQQVQKHVRLQSENSFKFWKAKFDDIFEEKKKQVQQIKEFNATINRIQQDKDALTSSLQTKAVRVEKLEADLTSLRTLLAPVEELYKKTTVPELLLSILDIRMHPMRIERMKLALAAALEEQKHSGSSLDNVSEQKNDICTTIPEEKQCLSSHRSLAEKSPFSNKDRARKSKNQSEIKKFLNPSSNKKERISIPCFSKNSFPGDEANQRSDGSELKSLVNTIFESGAPQLDPSMEEESKSEEQEDLLPLHRKNKSNATFVQGEPSQPISPTKDDHAKTAVKEKQASAMIDFMQPKFEYSNQMQQRVADSTFGNPLILGSNEFMSLDNTPELRGNPEPEPNPLQVQSPFSLQIVSEKKPSSLSKFLMQGASSHPASLINLSSQYNDSEPNSANPISQTLQRKQVNLACSLMPEQIKYFGHPHHSLVVNSTSQNPVGKVKLKIKKKTSSQQKPKETPPTEPRKSKQQISSKLAVISAIKKNCKSTRKPPSPQSSSDMITSLRNNTSIVPGEPYGQGEVLFQVESSIPTSYSRCSNLDQSRPKFAPPQKLSLQFQKQTQSMVQSRDNSVSKLVGLQEDKASAYGPTSPSKPQPIRFIKKEKAAGKSDPDTMPLQIHTSNLSQSVQIGSQAPKPNQEKNQLIYSKIKLSTKNRTRQEKIGPTHMTRSYQLNDEHSSKPPVVLHQSIVHEGTKPRAALIQEALSASSHTVGFTQMSQASNHNKQTFIKIKQKQLEKKKSKDELEKLTIRRNAVKQPKGTIEAPRKVTAKEVTEYHPVGKKPPPEETQSPFSINFNRQPLKMRFIK